MKLLRALVAVVLSTTCPRSLSFCSSPIHVAPFVLPWRPFLVQRHGRALPDEASGTRRVVRAGDVSPARRVRALSMRMEPAPLDRRESILVAARAFSAVAVASTATGHARPASAASSTMARRQASKRSPPFLCDDAVSYLQNPTKQSEIWIVGTAHISNSSAQLVENVIRDIKPQVVMVELDAQRVGSFLEEEKQSRQDAEGVSDDKPRSAKKKPKYFGAFFKQLLDPNVSVNDRVTDFFAAALGKAISKMYESMDDKGLSAGQEFTIAIREARTCGAKLLLGDRDVQVTLRRLSEAFRSTDLERLAETSQADLGLGLEALEVGSAESISSNLEAMKRRETMRKVIDFYKKEAPELYSAMISERDKVASLLHRIICLCELKALAADKATRSTGRRYFTPIPLYPADISLQYPGAGAMFCAVGGAA